MASARLLLVHACVHVSVLFVILPLLYLNVSAVLGAIIAAAEGWRTIDGVLYVGGNLALIRLTGRVPATTGGKVVDLIASMISFGALGWGLSIVGLLPFCDAARGQLHAASRPAHRDTRPMLASFLTALLFITVLWPLVCATVSLAVGAILMLAEGWTYENSFLRCLGVVSHTPSLAPRAEHPASEAGKIVILLNAFVAVGFTLGFPVGVCLLLPGLSTMTGLLSKVTLTRSDYFAAKCINFCVVILTVVPLVVLPLSLILGLVLNATEGWGSVMTGLLYVAGNMVGIPLSADVPTSPTGKVVDVVASCIATGCFGFLIAILGGLDFTDTCCDVLGGKIEGRRSAAKFTFGFYFLIMPMACVILAMPMGGLLSAVEGWDFGDSWLSVMSVLVQAPSLAPPGLRVKSDGGKVVVVIIACLALCVTIGWGAGLIGASKALGGVGDGIAASITRLKTAARVSDDAPAAYAARTPKFDCDPEPVAVGAIFLDEREERSPEARSPYYL